MRRSHLFLLSLLFGVSSVAFANPLAAMKDIDAKLASKPAISSEAASKVAKLRAEGEALHKAGKHEESMKVLDEAKKLLRL